MIIFYPPSFISPKYMYISICFIWMLNTKLLDHNYNIYLKVETREENNDDISFAPIWSLMIVVVPDTSSSLCLIYIL